MILPIVKYGHPTLRRKGVPIAEITPAIHRLIDDMFETMHEAAGVGLAAQQVGQMVQLTVIDVREVADRPSTLQLGGKEADPTTLMPLVLVNPEIKPFGEPASGPEGCLSFPEIYADITRPAQVEVVALDRQGQRLEFKAGGLLARVIQHEHDHLHGILFIDRMSASVRSKLQDELDALQKATRQTLSQTPG